MCSERYELEGRSVTIDRGSFLFARRRDSRSGLDGPCESGGGRESSFLSRRPNGPRRAAIRPRAEVCRRFYEEREKEYDHVSQISRARRTFGKSDATERNPSVTAP